jgi:hypothetical protein
MSKQPNGKLAKVLLENAGWVHKIRAEAIIILGSRRSPPIRYMLLSVFLVAAI